MIKMTMYGLNINKNDKKDLIMFTYANMAKWVDEILAI